MAGVHALSAGPDHSSGSRGRVHPPVAVTLRRSPSVVAVSERSACVWGWCPTSCWTPPPPRRLPCPPTPGVSQAVPTLVGE